MLEMKNDALQVGRRVQRCRQTLGFSRQTLAKDAGIQFAMLEQIEAGLKVPGWLECIEKISRPMGLPPETLLYDEDPNLVDTNQSVSYFADIRGLSAETTEVLRHMVLGTRNRGALRPAEQQLDALLRFVDSCPHCGRMIDIRHDFCPHCCNAHGLK